MKLPSFKRLITQDFDKEYQKLIEQLGGTINDAFNQVFFALNKRLTFKDNISATVRDVQVQVDTEGTPLSNTTFGLDVKNTPVIGCMVIQATNLTNSAIYPEGSVFISFTQIDNNILINNIKGLQEGYFWSIRVIAIN
jgi:hypothetical protein